MQVSIADVQSFASGYVAVAHAVVTSAGVSAAGEALRAMQNRLTWALKRGRDRSWKIAHEHTSAPFDFETSKPILQR